MKRTRAFIFAVLILTCMLNPQACKNSPSSPSCDENGEWIAFSDRDISGRLQIFLIREDGTGRRKLTSVGDNGLPRWSPNGSQIVFSTNRDGGQRAVYIMNSDGSNQHHILSSAHVADWSLNDELVFVSDPKSLGAGLQISKSDLSGNSITPLTTLADGGDAHIHPSWSPDGNRISYVQIKLDPNSPTTFNPEVWIMNSDGTNKRLVTTTNPDNLTPDGQFLNTAHDANAADYGPRGWISFWSGEEMSYGQVWKIRDDGTERTQLTSTAELTANDDPTWSPDGTKILFSTNRSGGGPELWIINSDGSDPHFVTDNSAVPFPGDADWQPKQFNH